MACNILTSAGLATCHGKIPDAVYTFSHALIQDAAYDSLLKSRRKQLHGDIAHLLEKRWPETFHTAPELLAYHYNSAEQFRVAASLWLRAGEIAIQRFAIPEAITHLRTGMSALSKLRPSKARDRMEISLRTALGPALVADSDDLAAVGLMRRSAKLLNPPGGSHRRSSKVLLTCQS
jgi:predicted ATPase